MSHEIQIQLPDELEISVERIHLEFGVPCSAHDCPVALAVIDALKKLGLKYPTVGVTPLCITVYPSFGSSREEQVTYTTPPELIALIREVDRHGWRRTLYLASGISPVKAIIRKMNL